MVEVGERSPPEPTLPRCPHGYLARVEIDDEGRHHPLAPEWCPICPPGPCGAPCRPGTPEEPVEPRGHSCSDLVECPTPGCVLIVEKGSGHKHDCFLEPGPWPGLDLAESGERGPE